MPARITQARQPLLLDARPTARACLRPRTASRTWPTHSNLCTSLSLMSATGGAAEIGVAAPGTAGFRRARAHASTDQRCRATCSHFSLHHFAYMRRASPALHSLRRPLARNGSILHRGRGHWPAFCCNRQACGAYHFIPILLRHTALQPEAPMCAV